MKVPTYEKETVIEKYVTTTIEYPTASGFLPVFPNGGANNFKLSIPSGKTPTKLILVSTKNILTEKTEIVLSIRSNTVGRVTFNRIYLIDSNNKKFSITFNEYWEEAGPLETVFKVKYNGTAYEKIKLNGTIITPKA